MYAIWVSLKALILVLLWTPLYFHAFGYFFRASYEAQLNSGISEKLVFFLFFSLINCFVEYFFHSEILHKYGSHKMHHKRTEGSNYAIMNSWQEKASHFPFWTLPAFFLTYSVFLLPLQFVVNPDYPLVLTGILSISSTYLIYEIKHQAHHGKFWKKWIALKSPWGRVGKWLYFHDWHRGHHEKEWLSLNIAGFFGLPLADIFFRTLYFSQNKPRKTA